jgi:uncharacterized protein (DUF169 family)
MVPFEGIARSLTDALHLSRPPIAVAFADSVPMGVEMFQGAVPAGCRFWQEAAERAFATISRDHEFCGIGVYTHHLEGSERSRTDLRDALKIFGDLGYVRPEDIPSIPVLDSEPKVVIYGPLDSIPVPPDVVLLFVKTDQMLILSELATTGKWATSCDGTSGVRSNPVRVQHRTDCPKSGLLRRPRLSGCPHC